MDKKKQNQNDKFLTNVPLLTDRSSVYIQIRNLKIPSATKMFKMIIRKCGRLESFWQRRLRDFLSLRDKQMKSDTCRAKTLTSHGPFLFLKPTTLKTEKFPHDSWVQVQTKQPFIKVNPSYSNSSKLHSVFRSLQELYQYLGAILATCKSICDLEESTKYYFGKREKCNKSNVKIVRNNGSLG